MVELTPGVSDKARLGFVDDLLVFAREKGEVTRKLCFGKGESNLWRAGLVTDLIGADEDFIGRRGGYRRYKKDTDNTRHERTISVAISLSLKSRRDGLFIDVRPRRGCFFLFFSGAVVTP